MKNIKRVNEMDRKLASIQKIVEVRDIPGADRIQVARVNAWDTVIRKDEYRAGDLCIFAEVDSILPFAPWSEFLRDKKNPDKPIRLKSVRLKKQLSQGLALPITILSQYGEIVYENGVPKKLIIKKE